MKRLWNTLLYGDRETRKCIGSVIFFVILALSLMIASGITAQVFLFIFGLIAGVVGLLISRSFTLVNDDYVAETGSKGEKDTVKAVTVQKKGGNKEEEKVETVQEEDTVRNKMIKSEMENEERVPHIRPDKLSEDMEGIREDTNYDHYDKQVLVKIKKKYRVRKDHRPILIDNSKSYHIKECPALYGEGIKRYFFCYWRKSQERLLFPETL